MEKCILLFFVSTKKFQVASKVFLFGNGNSSGNPPVKSGLLVIRKINSAALSKKRKNLFKNSFIIFWQTFFFLLKNVRASKSAVDVQKLLGNFLGCQNKIYTPALMALWGILS